MVDVPWLRRAHLRLLQTFGYVALPLCAIGVYGITAFAAHAQRREFAIRAALGASTRELTIAMIRRELAPVLLGLGIGLAVAVVIAPHLFAGAFDISPLDRASYIIAACVLLGTAALASYVPIRRAGAADPAEALAS